MEHKKRRSHALTSAGAHVTRVASERERGKRRWTAQDESPFNEHLSLPLFRCCCRGFKALLSTLSHIFPSRSLDLSLAQVTTNSSRSPFLSPDHSHTLARLCTIPPTASLASQSSIFRDTCSERVSDKHREPGDGVRVRE